MAWCLDAALSVGGTGRKPHLREQEICEATWLFDTFLLAYAHAASRFHGMGICLYKLRPKMHYTQHMVSELSFNKLNFYHAANFLDEDHMKFLKIVSAGCHVTSQPRTWARRYLTKQVFLWQQLQRDAGAKSKKKRHFAVKKRIDAAFLGTCAPAPFGLPKTTQTVRCIHRTFHSPEACKGSKSEALPLPKQDNAFT